MASAPRWVRTLSNPESDWVQKHFAPSPDPRRRCDTCHGEKLIRWYEDDDPSKDVIEYECDCIEQWMLQRFLLWVGIPNAYQRMSIKDARDLVQHNPDLFNFTHDWYEIGRLSGRGIILSGGHGVGKTLLAASMMKGLTARKGLDGKMVSSADLASMFINDDETVQWRYRVLATAEILWIDDLGQEYMRERMVDGAVQKVASEWTRTQFEALLRERVQMHRITSFTTNLSRDEITLKYGHEFSDLLSESCLFFSAGGTNWRPRAESRALEEMRQGIKRPVIA
jgi:DNA replication protein DnaC